MAVGWRGKCVRRIEWDDQKIFCHMLVSFLDCFFQPVLSIYSYPFTASWIFLSASFPIVRKISVSQWQKVSWRDGSVVNNVFFFLLQMPWVWFPGPMLGGPQWPVTVDFRYLMPLSGLPRYLHSHVHILPYRRTHIIKNKILKQNRWHIVGPWSQTSFLNCGLWCICSAMIEYGDHEKCGNVKRILNVQRSKIKS